MALIASATIVGLSTPSCADTENATQSDVAQWRPGEPRVYIVGLEDGDTVTGLVELQFAAEGFEIEEVGDGFARPGSGHFHLGIDADGCLDTGTLIPTAAPWIHFSDGSNAIELQLTPGEHRLVLQAGDAEHRAVDLCQSLRVTASDE